MTGDKVTADKVTADTDTSDTEAYNTDTTAKEEEVYGTFVDTVLYLCST